jgi:hypothetical protein
VAAAVARAIAQQGKPYDFDFDFFSSDRLVCTEVVYQAYQGPIRFDLPEIMGRRTLPALEIVRMWDRGRGRPDACLDLVGFLDGDEEHGTAAEAGEEALRASMDRPGSTGLQRGASGLPLFVTPPAAALAAMLFLGVLLFRRRRPRNLR